MKNLSTAIEVSKFLGVTPKTIRRWGKAGKIPFIRASRRVLRFDLDEVIEALKGGAARRGKK